MAADGGALNPVESRRWPDDGRSVVPNWVYTDPEIFAREQERIFNGPSWLFTCLEAEIPEPGDFKRSRLGAREVVAVRGADGAINVLVNRCAHRSMQFCQAESRLCQGVRLPLSPMDLRARRQIDRGAVPPRLQGARRHAGGFRPERARARKARGRQPQWRRLRQLRPAERDVRGLSRPEACSAISTASSTAANSKCSAIFASASRATGN